MGTGARRGQHHGGRQWIGRNGEVEARRPPGRPGARRGRHRPGRALRRAGALCAAHVGARRQPGRPRGHVPGAARCPGPVASPAPVGRRAGVCRHHQWAGRGRRGPGRAVTRRRLAPRRDHAGDTAAAGGRGRRAARRRDRGGAGPPGVRAAPADPRGALLPRPSGQPPSAAGGPPGPERGPRAGHPAHDRPLRPPGVARPRGRHRSRADPRRAGRPRPCALGPDRRQPVLRQRAAARSRPRGAARRTPRPARARRRARRPPLPLAGTPPEHP